MKAINQRLLVLSVLSSLGFLSSFAIFMWNLRFLKINLSMQVLLTASLTALLLVLTFREYGKLSFAQMIVQNKIILIQAAQVEQKLLRSNRIIISSDTIDIYISCFGILLGSRIIKFNADGVSLKRVDIGRNYVSIYFGKGKNEKFIRLLNNDLKESELGDIIKRFHYETGVVPNIIS